MLVQIDSEMSMIVTEPHKLIVSIFRIKKNSIQMNKNTQTCKSNCHTVKWDPSDTEKGKQPTS